MRRSYLPTEISLANEKDYFKEIETICEVLMSEKDLFPCEKINGLFSRLVHMTHPTYFRVNKGYNVAKLKDLPRRLQALCSVGEYQLELYWSQRIMSAPDPLLELSLLELYKFPYIKNYRDLTKLEYTNLSGCCEVPPRRVLFVGSGPLPLTSYFLAGDYGCEVENIDKSENAVSLARDLSVALKIDHQCKFRRCDVFELTGLERYEVIFLAALVGESQDEKLRILKHIHCNMANGALCVIPSAYGLRKLLYPEVPEDILIESGFRPVMLVHPLNDVIHSVLIGECIKEIPGFRNETSGKR